MNQLFPGLHLLAFPLLMKDILAGKQRLTRPEAIFLTEPWLCGIK
jgi:hypothetical protein